MPEIPIRPFKRGSESGNPSAFFFDRNPSASYFITEHNDRTRPPGGIGITPLWAMAKELTTSGREWRLYFSARSRAEMAFLDVLEHRPEAVLHFDDGADGAFLDIQAIASRAPSHAHLYCCSPPPMLEAFTMATQRHPSSHIHVEYFAPKDQASREGSFVVELARTGREFVIPAGQSILEVLLGAGLDVPYSCTEGVCGACETKVIAGIPDHRDAVLNVAEHAANKTMMICCSSCRNDRLVLDI
jgi:ferredoxin